jgi:hypothetical protein
MSATSHSPSPLEASDKKMDEKVALDAEQQHLDYAQGEDILALQDIDPALNAKMHIVNNVSSFEYSQILLEFGLTSI